MIMVTSLHEDRPPAPRLLSSIATSETTTQLLAENIASVVVADLHLERVESPVRTIRYPRPKAFTIGFDLGHENSNVLIGQTCSEIGELDAQVTGSR